MFPNVPLSLFSPTSSLEKAVQCERVSPEEKMPAVMIKALGFEIRVPWFEFEFLLFCDCDPGACYTHSLNSSSTKQRSHHRWSL
jgi:hypothetical protein